MPSDEIIVALATPMGRAALALIRLSGPGAGVLAQALSPTSAPLRPRRPVLRRLRAVDGAVLDTAMVTFFPGPRSFTGEDLVEIGCHGSPLIVEQVLAELQRRGARLARPGEFTRRGLERGRLGLLDAELLAERIEARSPAALDMVRRAEADLAPRIEAWTRRLHLLSAELEARLDHPGEDLGQMADEALGAEWRALLAELDAVAGHPEATRARLHGLRVALVGPVNAGKSSLFNALLGRARALVSEEEGTTRDVVEDRLELDGAEVILLDTAGWRAEARGVEAAGIALGRELSRQVDLHLLVLPGHLPPTPAESALRDELRDRPHRVLLSHADRDRHPARPAEELVFSNTSGEGLDRIRALLRQQLRGSGAAMAKAMLLLNARQQELGLRLVRHLRRGLEAFQGEAGPAVAAEAVLDGLQVLGELTGRDVREEALDALFRRFCIGK